MPVAARVDPAEVFAPDEWAALTAKSRWRGLWLVAHCWGAIGLCLVLGGLWPWLIPLLVPLVAARQLGLLILMHDAAHGLLHPNRRINDWVGKWLCSSALPVYRTAHLRHHRFAQQPEDPDLPLSRPFPIEAHSLRRKLLRDVTGASFLKLRLGIDLEARARRRAAAHPKTDPDATANAKPATKASAKATDLLSTGLDPRFVWGNLGFFVLFALAGYAWLWIALWLLPLACWFPLVYRLRNIAEHALVPVGEPDPYRHARTTRAAWWERALLAPYWVNYHSEHHLFTQLPCWNLPRAHALLAQRGLLPRMLVADGYRQVLREAV
ncbi:MAG TPA: fatty acid desaturase family protein, partial [Quisquiliibacterium sp.]|nr:fatty acid desaturase family protein [Quisquiliibacterium sp.]HQD83437.1 fatty acid desaturase family protein [Quisquiliibacterium sp.]